MGARKRALKSAKQRQPPSPLAAKLCEHLSARSAESRIGMKRDHAIRQEAITLAALVAMTEKTIHDPRKPHNSPFHNPLE